MSRGFLPPARDLQRRHPYSCTGCIFLEENRDSPAMDRLYFGQFLRRSVAATRPHHRSRDCRVRSLRSSRLSDLNQYRRQYASSFKESLTGIVKSEPDRICCEPSATQEVRLQICGNVEPDLRARSVTYGCCRLCQCCSSLSDMACRQMFSRAGLG